jgi:hypothetical protein
MPDYLDPTQQSKQQYTWPQLKIGQDQANFFIVGALQRIAMSLEQMVNVSSNQLQATRRLAKATEKYAKTVADALNKDHDA